jgi:DNA polymerase III subunit delta'
MRFSEIPGQQAIKDKLIRTVSDQRVSHAQLFYGPDSSAKLALAIAYAQYINCKSKKSAVSSQQSAISNTHSADCRLPTADYLNDACGVCPSCVKYSKLIHPDLHFIYPVATTKKVTKKPQSKLFSEDWRKFIRQRPFPVNLQDWYDFIGIENKQGIINVDDCNEIITTLSYKSYESEYKVMIIWMVEKLFHSAAPKILKILEEPPEKTLFLLISEDPDSIISTIKSRCLMVRIPPDRHIAGQEEEARENQYLGNFTAWMRNCYAMKVPELISFSADMAKSGRERQKAFLFYGLHILELCPAVVYGQAGRLNCDAEEVKFLEKFAPIIDSAGLAGFHDLLNNAIYHVERNAYAPALFLDLSLKILRLFKPNFVPL